MSVFLIPPICATYHTHISFGLITLIIIKEKYIIANPLIIQFSIVLLFLLCRVKNVSPALCSQTPPIYILPSG
jgi:hypothetical protein